MVGEQPMSTKAELTLLTKSGSTDRQKAVSVVQDWLNTQLRTRPNEIDAVYQELVQRLAAVDDRYPGPRGPMATVYLAADALHMLDRAERAVNRMRTLARTGTISDDEESDESDLSIESGSHETDDSDDGYVEDDDTAEDASDDISDGDDESEKLGRKLARKLEF